MILHDLLQQLDLADVEAIVDCLYDWGRILPEDVAETGRLSHLACYAALALWLRELSPAPLDEEEKDMILLGHQEKDVPSAEDDNPKTRVAVYLYRKQQLKRLDPGALAVNCFFSGLNPSDAEVAERLGAIAPKEWETSLYLCDFAAQLVACEVFWDNVVRCGLHAFLASVLFEMSFLGFYSDEYADAALAALARVVELLPMRPEEREDFLKRVAGAKAERDDDGDEEEADGCGPEKGPDAREAHERWMRAHESPAFKAAEQRVELWNSVQERRVLLRWLGAVPAYDHPGEDVT